MRTLSHKESISNGKKKRLRLAALGLILIGLWGMLALLLGDSVGKETHFRADMKSDLEPGFGETHATPHPLDKGTGRSTDLPPLCLDCLGTEEVISAASLDRPIDDGEDDATSSLGRSRNPEGNPPPLNIAQGGNPFLPGLFIPGGNPFPGGTPGGGNPNPPDNFNPPDSTPQNSNDTPPPDFTQPPFSLVPEGPPGGGAEGPGGQEEPRGPQGPQGPGGPGTPDQPIQIPEPLTLSLFATGVAGSIWLRRRKPHASR
jgi:hypothetical protein